ncbi:pyroglutamylated RFamide peptide receptor-like [Orbicella faveolata]|uniref:pyroglutamylated RFamide peptide receptor-like n=1 Tax=Orbicella faveolata TaxID=48498 RepID=UPI0009E3AC22|nr:pyroglutamylated RFamide peptide receptor-like [Orbicella faveolata]
MSLYKYSEAAQIGITAAFCFLVIADLVGNSLVCAVVLRNRVMRTPMNYLLVNLAVADMTVALFIAARYIFKLIFTHPKGTAGDVVCQLITGEPFVWVGALASTFSLVCIALERYLAIKFPYDERKRITTTKLKRIVVLDWVLALLWNMPLFMYARYDPVSEFCLFKWPTANFVKFHSPLGAIVYVVLPITVMIYLYSKLVYKLWFRPTTTSTMAQQKKLHFCKKTARLVVTVSVIYSICWIPNIVVYVFSSFSRQPLYSAVHTTSIVLVTLNSAINPVLYSWQSDRFRKHILALFPCTRQRCRISPAKPVTCTDKDSNKTSGLTELIQFVSRGPMA